MLTTHIGKYPVAQLVEQFGTPLYAYDWATIAERVVDLRGFPVIRYAQKANSNLALLSMLRQVGVEVDAVSAGEIYRALKAGYEPHQIVYTADIFDHAALDLVLRHRLPVNCGSMDMIKQLGQATADREITLRINPGFGHGHSQKTNTGGPQSKHGIWHEQLSECLQLAAQFHLRVTGIHMHIGSGTDFEHLAQVVQALKDGARQVGASLRRISAGGGLPTPYRPQDQRLDMTAFTRMWLEAQQELENELGQPIQLEIEPGRYLVAEAGYLIAEIRAVKHQGDNLFYVVNAGFNNLARPILYGAYHPISICPGRNRTVLTNNPELKDVVIGGPLCESGDIFTQTEGGFVEKRRLPSATVGDFVIFHCAGAYGFAMSSNYNSMPYAAEVLLLEGKPHPIRQRQSLEQLIQGECILDLKEGSCIAETLVT